MGCDWDIYIQARYGNKWTTMYHFETKTRCGGGPIRTGLVNLSQNSDITNVGSYGIEYKTEATWDFRRDDIYSGDYEENTYKLDNLNKEYDENGNKKTAEEPRKKKSKTDGGDDNENDIKEEAILHPEEIIAERKKLEKDIRDLQDRYRAAGKIGNYPAHHVYLLSIPQYEALIRSIPETENPHYGNMLSPIAKWAEMMKSAAPDDDSPPWMDDSEKFVAEITEHIKELQSKRNYVIERVYGLDLALLSKKWNLPAEVTRMMFHYLGADDMRIAIYDDEHNSRCIREGDYSSNGCTVM